MQGYGCGNEGERFNSAWKNTEPALLETFRDQAIQGVVRDVFRWVKDASNFGMV